MLVIVMEIDEGVAASGGNNSVQALGSSANFHVRFLPY